MGLLKNDLREEVAKAIYEAAYDKYRGRPSPGWCWEGVTEDMREFCRRQADFALKVVRLRKDEL
jgi:hypothetical protein